MIIYDFQVSAQDNKKEKKGKKTKDFNFCLSLYQHLFHEMMGNDLEKKQFIFDQIFFQKQSSHKK